ncbi:uncharacterized protein LOC127831366 [Dreissena polymorpha]|uniref:uncharacterized protein LOC127831366 n=1 Tax=Dreissena polymorpha TaxID=45954 RepID=UPI0022651748|nr:uncharacterized protein LOC127831366 [Dreissena polymorpha]
MMTNLKWTMRLAVILFVGTLMVSAQISSDELGLSCSSGDDLGLSLGSDSDSEEADEVGMSLSSSSESSCDDDLDVQLSIDVDSVYARPPPMKPVNRLLFCKLLILPDPS